MTTRWFPSALKTAEAPPGMRIYAIGDVHGRADLLHVLAEAIAEDLAARRCEQAVTVFVGDYVDHGLGANGVLKRLCAGDFPDADRRRCAATMKKRCCASSMTRPRSTTGSAAAR